MKSKLINIFDDLNAPIGDDNEDFMFNSTKILQKANIHLGKDHQARPVIIVGNLFGKPQNYPAIELENLSVKHGILCRISASEGPSIEEKFSLIHCLSEERPLHLYFLQTMEMILESIPASSPSFELSEAITRLAKLFHSLIKPASRSTQGLWGELFLIVNSNNPLIMLEAWHSDANERFDFCLNGQRIEVKCSRNRKRQHHFSFEQVYPPPGVSVLIASLFVEPVTNGLTLGDLWDKARRLAVSNTNLSLKIEDVCIEALGATWNSALKSSYDEPLAKQSLQFYDIEKIPRVLRDQVDGVSEIRFCSDLDLASPETNTSSASEGPLFDACFR